MIKIADIVKSIDNNRIRITDHADEEAQSDNLSIDDILYSVKNGEIIESYLDDKPYPSCLINGQTLVAQPVHSVWAYNEQNGWAVLITVYRPTSTKWLYWRDAT